MLQGTSAAERTYIAPRAGYTRADVGHQQNLKKEGMKEEVSGVVTASRLQGILPTK